MKKKKAIKGLPKQRGQMSETFVVGLLLTLSGGFQDAYTYSSRENVFANAQTGNIVLMSQNVCTGNFQTGLRYLVPLIAFALGVFVAERIRQRYRCLSRVHWRQLVLVGEIALLFAVGFLPQRVNLLANALVSFVCAMQVQAFRKVNGNAYASTMCIGNLRSAMEHLCTYRDSKEKSSLKRSLQYFSVLFLFAIGAAFGSIFTNWWGERAIWVSCVLLLVGFLLMFVKEESKEDACVPLEAQREDGESSVLATEEKERLLFPGRDTDGT